jgi:hypothetical protein
MCPFKEAISLRTAHLAVAPGPPGHCGPTDAEFFGDFALAYATPFENGYECTAHHDLPRHRDILGISVTV